MRLLLVAGALVAALLPAAAAPAPRDATVLAIDWRSVGAERLVLADARTLHPRREPSLALDGHVWPYALGADRRRLVLAGRRSLRLVDLRGPRLIGDVPLGDGIVKVRAVAWLGRRIVALVERRTGLSLVQADAGRRRVVASIGLGRVGAHPVASRSRFAVLLWPIGRIGTASVVTVAAEGPVRSLALGGIRAGLVRPRAGRPRTVVRPGLALAVDQPRAWVIGGARSAELDLSSAEVRYLGRPREPSSRRKEPGVGSAYEARWLRPGLLATSGWEWNGSGSKPLHPTGVRLLDTRTWTERTIHPDAVLFYVRGQRLLTMAPGGPACPGPELISYAFDGVESFRLCERGAAGDITFAGPYARLGRIDGHVSVVDLARGTVVARVHDVRVAPLQEP